MFFFCFFFCRCCSSASIYAGQPSGSEVAFAPSDLRWFNPKSRQYKDKVQDQTTEFDCKSQLFQSLNSHFFPFGFNQAKRRFIQSAGRGVTGRLSFVLRLCRGHEVTTFREKSHRMGIWSSCIISPPFALNIVRVRFSSHSPGVVSDPAMDSIRFRWKWIQSWGSNGGWCFIPTAVDDFIHRFDVGYYRKCVIQWLR